MNSISQQQPKWPVEMTDAELRATMAKMNGIIAQFEAIEPAQLIGEQREQWETLQLDVFFFTYSLLTEVTKRLGDQLIAFIDGLMGEEA